MTIVAVSALIFLGVEALPGDLAEAILGQDATPEAVSAFRKELKLDLPPHERYFSWLSNMLRGDFGISMATQEHIREMIGWRLKNTLFLAACAAAVSIPLALILGFISVLYRGRMLDRCISIGTLAAISVPEFFAAYILISLLSVKLQILPSMATLEAEMSLPEKLKVITGPCLTLSFVILGHMMRMTRAAIINVLSQPYIEMALLKGVQRINVVIKHAFPNAISPIINVIAINMAYLIVGVVVVEVVFVYPGLGQLMVDSVSTRDIPVVQACGLIFALAYITLNLVADILSAISNPRLLHVK